MELIESRRRILLSAPHVEATTPAGVANFSTDLISPLKSLKAGFLPVQAGSGDPSPSNVRPISGWSGVIVKHLGKNLINVPDTTTSGYVFNLSNLKIPAGTYTLSMDFTTDVTPSVAVSGPDGDYINTSKQLPYTFTVSGMITGIRCYVSVQQTYSNIQLERGSTATPYSPYTGTAIPVTFPAAGKNLFNVNVPEKNPSDTTQGNTKKRIFEPYTYCVGIAASNYFSASAITDLSISNGTISITTNSAYGVGFALPLTPGKTYRIDATGTNMRINAACYAADGTFLQENNSLNTNGFTVPANSAITVIVFVCKTANTEATYSDIMLYEGTTYTPYEPYRNAYYGGYVDLVRGEVVAETAKMSVAAFTGIVANHGNPNGNVFYLQTLISTIRNDTLISNRFVRLTLGYSSMPLYSFSGTWGANDYVYFVIPSTIQTLEDANAWLNDNPTEFVYKLATPIHYPLTPQIIKSLRGTNNIWSDANGDMSVEYWKH